MLPDFDTLMALAAKNPEALERIRQEEIETLINSASEANQPRLRGLQWQVDIEIKKCKSPMEGCVNVSKKMHDKLWELKVAIDHHDNGRVDEFFYDEVVDETAKVIPLRG